MRFGFALLFWFHFWRNTFLIMFAFFKIKNQLCLFNKTERNLNQFSLNGQLQEYAWNSTINRWLLQYSLKQLRNLFCIFNFFLDCLSTLLDGAHAKIAHRASSGSELYFLHVVESLLHFTHFIFERCRLCRRTLYCSA